MSRCAIVTGCSNGIGEAIVKELAKLNYKLVVTGRCPEDVQRVALECAKLSPTNSMPLEVVANLEDEQEVDRLFKESIKFLENKLHLLVNNAGQVQSVAHTNTEACYSTFSRVMQINLMAGVRLTLLAAPYLKSSAIESDEPSNVVNISSIAAKRPGETLAAYGTSKAALNAFTEAMAVELGPLIRVNAISPGPVETKIVERSGNSLEQFKMAASRFAPMARVGQPKEVAEALVYMIDNSRSSFITGANLTIDGGYLLSPMLSKCPDEH